MCAQWLQREAQRTARGGFLAPSAVGIAGREMSKTHRAVHRLYVMALRYPFGPFSTAMYDLVNLYTATIVNKRVQATMAQRR